MYWYLRRKDAMRIIVKNHRANILILLIVTLLFSACTPSDDSTPEPTSVVISRQLATLGPTPTPDPNQVIIQPTSTPTLTPIPSPTNYIGVFLGEIEPQDDLLSNEANSSSDAGVVVLPDVEINPVICPEQADLVFGTAWEAEGRALNGLGCPIQVAFGFDARVQFFENGVMYLRPDTNEVWAISPGGLTGPGESWFVTRLPDIVLSGFDPPTGLQVPVGIIGAAWGGTTEIRQTLGFATTGEQETPINIQRFAGGTLLLDVDVGQVFALLVDGTTYGPF